MTTRSGSLFKGALTWGTIESREINYCFMDFSNRGLLSEGRPSIWKWFRMVSTLIYYSIIGKKL